MEYYYPSILAYQRVNGEQTFGETAISLDYIDKTWSDWKVVACDLNLIDPYQLIVFLEKR